MISEGAASLIDVMEPQDSWEPVHEGRLTDGPAFDNKEETDKVFGGWDVLDPILKQRLLVNNQLPRQERQSIINVLREFALEYHKSIRSVQARYYQVIKKEIEAGNIPEELENRANETVRMLPCNYPKQGDTVNTRVVNLIDYGVFLETDTGYTGFLRMGDVTSDEWLAGRSDLERYFYQGEKVKVKVIKVADDKLYFSTKAIGGKKPNLLEAPKGNEIKLARGSQAEGELTELIRLLSGRIGQVSDPCKALLSELLLTYGPVRVTARTLECFTEFDQGFWLMRQVKDHLDGEFNRLN